MRLKRFLLRYYPPGILLEYRSKTSGETVMRSVNLFDLTHRSDAEDVVNDVITRERLNRQRKGQLLRLVRKLIEKQKIDVGKEFSARAAFRPHPAPMCNYASNKDGSMMVTASYDSTCRVWGTMEAAKLRSLEGHTKAVFSVAFNNPFGNLVVTGSFDHTARLWNPETAECQTVLEGSSGELVKVLFSPDGRRVAAASMDKNIYVWDAETGKSLAVYKGHKGPVSCLVFEQSGKRLLSASVDNTVKVWDCSLGVLEGGGVAADGAADVGGLAQTLEGHTAEIAGLDVSFMGDRVISGGADSTARLWDLRTESAFSVLEAHGDEVTDVAFNPQGTVGVTSSLDGCLCLLDGSSGKVISRLMGHGGAVNSACFNPQGSKVVSTGADATARLWDAESGSCQQVLKGHNEELFSASFNYDGDVLMTASLDWTCRVWSLVSPEETPAPMLTRPGTALPGQMRSGGFTPGIGGAGDSGNTVSYGTTRHAFGDTPSSPEVRIHR